MGLGDRSAKRHDTDSVRRTAGVDSSVYWDYHPGQTVMTVDGFLGTVQAVNDGPHAGNEEYEVQLHNGMGGGLYTSSQLRAASQATASQEHEAAANTAALDYPELAEILERRPDPGKYPSSTSARYASLSKHASVGGQPGLCDNGHLAWGGDCASCRNADTSANAIVVNPGDHKPQDVEHVKNASVQMGTAPETRAVTEDDDFDPYLVTRCTTGCGDGGIKVVGDRASQEHYIAVAQDCHDEAHGAQASDHRRWHSAEGHDCWSCCPDMHIAAPGERSSGRTASLKAQAAPSNYICKGCGAQSPTGIGYASSQTGFPAPAHDCPGPHVTPFTGEGGSSTVSGHEHGAWYCTGHGVHHDMADPGHDQSCNEGCSKCQSGVHTDDEHDCEHCGSEEHTTEEHPECEVCGSDEHEADEHEDEPQEHDDYLGHEDRGRRSGYYVYHGDDPHGRCSNPHDGHPDMETAAHVLLHCQHDLGHFPGVWVSGEHGPSERPAHEYEEQVQRWGPNLGGSNGPVHAGADGVDHSPLPESADDLRGHLLHHHGFSSDELRHYGGQDFDLQDLRDTHATHHEETRCPVDGAGCPWSQLDHHHSGDEQELHSGNFEVDHDPWRSHEYEGNPLSGQHYDPEVPQAPHHNPHAPLHPTAHDPEQAGEHYNPHRDRQELERANNSGGSEYGDHVPMSFSHHHDLPAEGESVDQWLERTAPAKRFTECSTCKGKGNVRAKTPVPEGVNPWEHRETCKGCGGSGHLRTDGTPATRDDMGRLSALASANTADLRDFHFQVTSLRQVLSVLDALDHVAVTAQDLEALGMITDVLVEGVRTSHHLAVRPTASARVVDTERSGIGELAPGALDGAALANDRLHGLRPQFEAALGHVSRVAGLAPGAGTVDGRSVPEELVQRLGLAALAATLHPSSLPVLEESRTGRKVALSAQDDDFRFSFTAAWSDVRAKAKRIRAEGGVHITLAEKGYLIAQVKGEHGTYESVVMRYPGTEKIAAWDCGCKWAQYHWGAPDDNSRFAGRQCSHNLALVFEAQARGMFGRTITQDQGRASWLDQSDPVITSVERGMSHRTRLGSLNDPWGYVADAAIHCPDCAKAHYGEDLDNAHDGEGNPVTPLNGWDESDAHGEHCGTCHTHLRDGYEHTPDEGECQYATGCPTHGLAHTAEGCTYGRRSENSGPQFCGHCGRNIVHHPTEGWIDPDAPATPEDGDDHIWRAQCDSSPHFDARHEPGSSEIAGRDTDHGGDQMHGPDYSHPDPFAPVMYYRPRGEKHEGLLMVHGSVNSPFGEPVPGSLPKQPATMPRNPSDNPASAGFLTAADPASWSEQGPSLDPVTGGYTDERGHRRDICTGCLRPINDAGGIDPGVPWVHDHSHNAKCDVGSPADAVMLQGVDTQVAQPMTDEDWHHEASLDDALFEASLSTLHDEPEPALPSTDGSAEDDLKDSLEVQAGVATGTEYAVPTDPGQSGNAADAPGMGLKDSDDDSLSPENLSIESTGSLEEVIAQFQRTAGAGAIMAGGKAASADGMDLAAAAKAHLEKTSMAVFTPAQQQELINEGEGVKAANLDRLQIEGTHYEALDAALAHLDEDEGDSWMA